MKKSVIFALALAVPAMAGTATTAPVIIEAAPAAAASPWAVEIAGVHTWAVADSYDEMHNINTWGVDVTAIYNVTDKWAATFRFSYADGSGRFDDGTDVFKEDITNWAITAGARYTSPITEKLSWFAGANIGWGRSEVTDVFTDATGYREKHFGDDIGVAYSAEVGVKYDICKRVYAVGAVGARGYWTTPNVWDFAREDQQFGITVSAGLGGKF